MQPGDGEVDRQPDAVGAGAQEIAFLGVEDAGLAGGVAQAFLASLAAEAEEVGGIHAKQLRARKAAQLLGGGVDVEEGVAVRVEQEQGVPGFVEQGTSQAFQVIGSHGKSLCTGQPSHLAAACTFSCCNAPAITSAHSGRL